MLPAVDFKQSSKKYNMSDSYLCALSTVEYKQDITGSNVYTMAMLVLCMNFDSLSVVSDKTTPSS